jgi:hypothetical protein
MDAIGKNIGAVRQAIDLNPSTPPPLPRPRPQLITASRVKFDLLKFAYNRYMHYYYTPNKNSKEELRYLCDVSLFLSDDFHNNNYIVDNYLNTYFDVMEITDDTIKNRIRQLLIADTHYYPTFLEDGLVKWIIEPSKFVPLVNEINTRCKNKLSTETINMHLTERNIQIEYLRMNSTRGTGAFKPEIYNPPEKSEKTDGDTQIEIRPPEIAQTKNEPSLFKRLFTSSKKVHPIGGNSIKSKSRKPRKTKSRKPRKSKQRKRKSNSRI